MQLRVGAGTSIGRVRTMNEDAFTARPSLGLFVVCDGMGGGPAGEVASQLAVSTIAEHVRRAAACDGGPACAGGDGYLAQTQRLADAVRRSNRRILEHAMRQPAQAGMASTVVSVWIGDHVASVAHVGDSRAYLWHEGRLEALTRDHALEDRSHILVRVLGREPDVDVDVAEVPLRAGDYLLLCSDGLTRMVPERLVAQTIGRGRDPQRICDELITAANSNGGADNVTVVVVEMARGWWQRFADRWTRTPWRGHDAEADAAV